MERDLLNERINNRVDEMFRDGLVEETQRLLEIGLERNRTAMQAIGYKEVVGCLKGEYSLERARELLKRNSRRYAKRQLTWFRKDDRIKWFDTGSDTVSGLVADILSHLAGLGYDSRQGGLSGQ
jgi:tRNA dimethylallyltransferase